VRKIVGGYVKLLYPDGEFTKEQLEEILVFALEMGKPTLFLSSLHCSITELLFQQLNLGNSLNIVCSTAFRCCMKCSFLLLLYIKKYI